MEDVLQDLWERWRRGGADAARTRDALILEACRRFVGKSLSAETAGVLLTAEQREDLRQQARIGIVRALENIDRRAVRVPSQFLIGWARLEVRKTRANWTRTARLSSIPPGRETQQDTQDGRQNGSDPGDDFRVARWPLVSVVSLEDLKNGERIEESLVSRGDDARLLVSLRVEAGLTRDQTRAVLMRGFQKRDDAEIARVLRRSVPRAAGIVRAGERKIAAALAADGVETAPVRRGLKLITKIPAEPPPPKPRGRPRTGRSVWTGSFATNSQTQSLLYRLEDTLGLSHSDLIRRAVSLLAREALGERIPRALRVAPHGRR